MSPATLKALNEVRRRAVPFFAQPDATADDAAVLEALRKELEPEFTLHMVQGIGLGLRIALGPDLAAPVITSLFGADSPVAIPGNGVSPATASKWIVKCRSHLGWPPEFPGRARAGHRAGWKQRAAEKKAKRSELEAQPKAEKPPEENRG